MVYDPCKGKVGSCSLKSSACLKLHSFGIYGSVAGTELEPVDIAANEREMVPTLRDIVFQWHRQTEQVDKEIQ